MASRLRLQPRPDFCRRSLGHWLALVDGAMPHIPAEEVGWFRCDELLHLGGSEVENSLRNLAVPFVAAHLAGRSLPSEPYLLRSDFGVPSALFELMHEGNRVWNAAAAIARFSFAEERVLSRAWDAGLDTMAVWRRPWCACEFYGGYPVQFRAFVRDGRLEGVTSRYTQRALPETPYLPWALEAGRLALLCDALGTYSMDFLLQRYPEDPGKRRNPSAPACRLTFLDGGEGSHVDDLGFFAPDDIDGVALEWRVPLGVA